jgi:hypothetical protein
MDPKTKKPQSPPPPAEPKDDGDFAEEVAPKETEFGSEKDAKDLTAGDFEPIP